MIEPLYFNDEGFSDWNYKSVEHLRDNYAFFDKLAPNVKNLIYLLTSEFDKIEDIESINWVTIELYYSYKITAPIPYNIYKMGIAYFNRSINYYDCCQFLPEEVWRDIEDIRRLVPWLGIDISSSHIATVTTILRRYWDVKLEGEYTFIRALLEAFIAEAEK